MQDRKACRTFSLQGNTEISSVRASSLSLPSRSRLRVRLGVGHMAVINNRRVLHGREEFVGHRNLVSWRDGFSSLTQCVKDGMP